MSFTLTQDEIEDAFTEWECRFRADPDAFFSAQERMHGGMHPRTYGELATPYFLSIVLGLTQESADV